MRNNVSSLLLITLIVFSISLFLGLSVFQSLTHGDLQKARLPPLLCMMPRLTSGLLVGLIHVCGCQAVFVWELAVVVC